MPSEIMSHPRCTLGEGPIWHPTQQRFYWVDIPEKRLYCQSSELKFWQFEQMPSAIAWVDEQWIVIAMESGLYRFDSLSDSTDLSLLVAFDHDSQQYRSNDGRADPWGGFWISTLSLDEIQGEGKIYRFYQGKLQLIVDGLTIPNGICFSADKQWGYYADSPSSKIYRVKLNPDDGSFLESAQVFVDRSEEQLIPDGAIIDANNQLWTTHWGSSEIVCYSSDGQLIKTIKTDAIQPTCPAFGGNNLQDLFVTSASIGLNERCTQADGQVLKLFDCGQGKPEPALQL
ncbi:SMP-30/gluconolactonase/LRE family protein [Alginatibacterium sediminis]|uniref:SMP-30/gluconolactonase/LRE family protein n=1 Tax=Alginatibacterium sediminis TaxID=2164068 RepID=A0A420E9Q1_9ALTE|nr:SMP-30/gluconolactonase/LRE family protein [Alginatibacterium sediminis]RKF17401.1 SMP-30/gluconolactonase/LRE family protein [Alginatibacterium sediminis]